MIVLRRTAVLSVIVSRQLKFVAVVVLLAAVLIVNVVVWMLIGPHQHLFHFDYPYRLSTAEIGIENGRCENLL